MSSLKDLLNRSSEKPILLIVPTEKEASQIASTLNARYFPGPDVFPFEEVPVSFFVRKGRIETLWSLLNEDQKLVVASLYSVSRFTFPVESLKSLSKKFRRGETFIDAFRLQNLGYERTYLVRSGGEFSIRGDIIDVFPPVYERPIRIELFGNSIEDIRGFDVISQTSIEKLEEFVLLPAREYACESHDYDTIVGKAGSNGTIFDYANFEILLVDADRCFEEFAKLERQIREFLSDEQYEEYRKYSGLNLAELQRRLQNAKEVQLELQGLEYSEKKTGLLQVPIIDEEELNVGAVLIVDEFGIPQEFKYTEPVSPTPLQKILYGKSLDLYLTVEIIAKSLLKNVEQKPEIFLTDNISLVESSDQVYYVSSHPATKSEQDQDSEPNECVISSQTESLKFIAKSNFSQDKVEKLKKIVEEFDVMEPFQRLAKALEFVCRS